VKALNVEYTLQYLLKNGAIPHKTVLGKVYIYLGKFSCVLDFLTKYVTLTSAVHEH
jgi:hypothetical protein